jgi:predicted glycoside hydrolase/deacetylase ChbG (UPF0249 family)
MLAAAGASAGAAQAPKTLAERLGYTRDDRILMLHADDIGMCHSVNVATTKAFAEGLVTTASVMVPCPWFPEIAAWSAEHPEWDLGLHLTLTSEWRYYRWRPVTPVDKVPTLVDRDGFLWRSVEDVKKHAAPEHVEMEIRAQIARARQFGMKPTHVDSHMGTLFADARFFEAYTRVAKETGLLPMLMEPSPEINLQAKALGLDYPPLAEKLRGQGFLLLDRLITGATANGYEARKKQYHDMIRSLKPGVTEIILHLAGDDEEIRAVTGNWAYRWHEYRIFTDADTKALIREQKIRLIGYRQLAALWNKPA